MRMIRIGLLLASLLLFFALFAQAQSTLTSRQLADMILRNHDSLTDSHGLLLEGMSRVWYNTGDGRYFEYVKQQVDHVVNEDGTFHTSDNDAYSRNNVLIGPELVMLYGVLNEPKYYGAAKRLVAASKIAQDNLSPSELFRAQYAAMFHESANFDVIAAQLIATEALLRSSKTGLAPDPKILGWYAKTLVDVLPFFPENHPKRAELIAALKRTLAASQVEKTTSNKGSAKKNRQDTSATCMFIYAAARGSRLGFLPMSYQAVAERTYSAIEQNSPGNDASAIGAFLLAASEVDIISATKLGQGKTVVLDSWFNNETRKDITGTPVIFHYKWNELSNPGFWFVANIFHNFGAHTKELFDAPAPENLANVDIYIIINPDNTAKVAQPNYMDDARAKVIADWVKNGGVLLMMENNAGNSDFEHFNKLSEKFGIHFNEVTRNRVEGVKFEQGKLMVQPGNSVLKNAKQIYMKEICTITLEDPAKPVLEDKGDVLIAVSRYGKGTVLAVVDPWLYNEYVDGRRLPPDYENLTAAQDIVRWLIEQVPANK